MKNYGFEQASTLEWIETNGLGGWASSTIIGLNTRRYHGLLVAATKPPLGRIVLISKLEETIISGNERFALGVNHYPGAIHPHGHHFLSSFEKDLFPVFEYNIEHNAAESPHQAEVTIRLRKTIAALNGENTTLIIYELLNAPGLQSFSIILELRPFIAARSFHALQHANQVINHDWSFENSVFSSKPYDDSPKIFLSIPSAQFVANGEWYYNFEYPLERYRGLDFKEDLFSYGVFKIGLKPGDRLGVIVSTRNPEGRDAGLLFEKERRRRRRLLASIPPVEESYAGFVSALFLAADQFIVRRGNELLTVIAGYHWFGDWGRDTMIALPGLCLCTGRYEEAKNILRAFGKAASKGMLPNHFPDDGREPEYNTVDAALWFFVASYEYANSTADITFIIEEILPVFLKIILWYESGTRYGIRVDNDGLLRAGADGTQLTWMDAKIGDRVVTPRRGKAVEINALWYNALMIAAEFCESSGKKKEAILMKQKAQNVKEQFRLKFWCRECEYLYDILRDEETPENGDQFVFGDRVQNGTDAGDRSLRPNQLLALSLPFPLVETKNAEKILKITLEKLYTPRGLRTISPDHKQYRSHYGGDVISRDSAYHQGTVWAWLLGPLIAGLVRYLGDEGKREARMILSRFKPHLLEAGVGTVSEIFDGDFPHKARGCIAQAWSVAEILRAALFIAGR